MCTVLYSTFAVYLLRGVWLLWAVSLVVLCLGFQHIHNTIAKFSFAALYCTRLESNSSRSRLFFRVIGSVYSHVGRFLNDARRQLRYSTVARIGVGSDSTVLHSVQ
jgi:hypothetical protein